MLKPTLVDIKLFEWNFSKGENWVQNSYSVLMKIEKVQLYRVNYFHFAPTDNIMWTISFNIPLTNKKFQLETYDHLEINLNNIHKV